MNQGFEGAKKRWQRRQPTPCRKQDTNMYLYLGYQQKSSSLGMIAFWCNEKSCVDKAEESASIAESRRIGQTPSRRSWKWWKVRVPGAHWNWQLATGNQQLRRFSDTNSQLQRTGVIDSIRHREQFLEHTAHIRESKEHVNPSPLRKNNLLEKPVAATEITRIALIPSYTDHGLLGSGYK
ncbi:uncharacterized protein PADG_03151 [Paracoccidioides brasiliensis Pb18]|uniref:Uncharacterized protein n=1 Tax=Paracoccidioides brasiliensis (strain Pb18) TaxID=502780 RepID=C1G7J6_PARBD|nr:uncharacterized protein PADG_03151 [Paracoccidioides brasiliensis Pb18]EEH47053.2 hypothetical protein PADG_03151 [Paracoccidioides brasiliensis Pb18]